MDDDRRTDKAADDKIRSGANGGRYEFLVKLSHRLGRTATRSSFIRDMRDFIRQDGVSNTFERLIAHTKSLGPESRSDTSSHDKAKRGADNLKELVSRSHELLASANTVFPLTLFPDTIALDRTKVTITKRDFFWSSDVLSIRIEDVLNVSVSVGPLFGSLTIASRVMSTVDHFRIDHFWRRDAIRLKHIIQGYVIAQHNDIDTAHLEKKELIETLMELGHDSNNQK